MQNKNRKPGQYTFFGILALNIHNSDLSLEERKVNIDTQLRLHGCEQKDENGFWLKRAVDTEFGTKYYDPEENGLVVNKSADFEDAHFKNRKQRLLATAVKYKREFELIRWLVDECGADVNLGNVESDGETLSPLAYAAQNNDIQVMSFLLARGADPAGIAGEQIEKAKKLINTAAVSESKDEDSVAQSAQIEDAVYKKIQADAQQAIKKIQHSKCPFKKQQKINAINKALRGLANAYARNPALFFMRPDQIYSAKIEKYSLLEALGMPRFSLWGGRFKENCDSLSIVPNRFRHTLIEQQKNSQEQHQPR